MQLAHSIAAGVDRWWKDPGPELRPIRSLPWIPGIRRGAIVPGESDSVFWFPDDGIDLGESASTYGPDEQLQGRPVLEHGIDTGIFDVLLVPVSQAGFVGVFDVNGDGVTLIARTLDKTGNLIESSDSARLFIQVNNERSIPLPFSFQFNQAGAQKCDLMSIVARVQRVWITVQTATQDPLNQPFVIVAFTKAVGISGLFGSSGFASAAAPGGGGANAAATTATSGAGAAPGTGGGTSSGGGGIPTGGGGGDGGGGGGRSGGFNTV